MYCSQYDSVVVSYCNCSLLFLSLYRPTIFSVSFPLLLSSYAWLYLSSMFEYLDTANLFKRLHPVDFMIGSMPYLLTLLKPIAIKNKN